MKLGRNAAALSLVFALAACGGSSKPESSEATGSAAPKPAAAAPAPSTAPATALCALPSSTVVIGAGNKVSAFNPDGSPAWTLDLPNGDTVVSAPVGAMNSNTFVRGAKAIYAIGTDGKVMWQVADNDPGASIHGLVALGDSTIVVTHADDSIVNYSAEGQPRWTYSLPKGEKLAADPVVAPSSFVYLRGAATVYAVDPTGALSWQKDLPR